MKTFNATNRLLYRNRQVVSQGSPNLILTEAELLRSKAEALDKISMLEECIRNADEILATLPRVEE